MAETNTTTNVPKESVISDSEGTSKPSLNLDAGQLSQMNSPSPSPVASPTEKSKLNPLKKEEEKSLPLPPVSALMNRPYDEGDDIEVLQASNGHTYGFRKSNKTPRKIYFSMKINRFSDIDTVRESFRARFHLYLNWIITKKEYETYLQYKEEQKKKKIKSKWEPKFKPRIEFINNVEGTLYFHANLRIIFPFVFSPNTQSTFSNLWSMATMVVIECYPSKIGWNQQTVASIAKILCSFVKN